MPHNFDSDIDYWRHRNPEDAAFSDFLDSDEFPEFVERRINEAIEQVWCDDLMMLAAATALGVIATGYEHEDLKDIRERFNDYLPWAHDLVKAIEEGELDADPIITHFATCKDAPSFGDALNTFFWEGIAESHWLRRAWEESISTSHLDHGDAMYEEWRYQYA